MFQLQKNPFNIVSSSIRVSSFGDEICCCPQMQSVQPMDHHKSGQRAPQARVSRGVWGHAPP